jgi:chorismate mutase
MDADEPDHVMDRVKALMHELFERNGLDADDVISIFVTGTPDLTTIHPATAVRAYGLADVPLIGAQELWIDGTLAYCVRVMLHIDTDKPRSELRHVFLEGAVVLRPDLVEGQ